MNILNSCAFSLAFISLFLRWFKPISHFWYVPFVLSLIIATIAGIIDIIVLVTLAIATALVVACKKKTIFNSTTDKIIKLLLVLFSFLLALHLIPGVHNINIISHAVIKDRATPYSLWLNYDKTLAGIILLVCFIDVSNVKPTYRRILAWTLGGVVGNTLFIMIPSLACGMIAWDPGKPSLFATWALSNLLITSMAEEVFFRGVLQQKLENLLHSYQITLASVFAVLITAVLFGLAHIAGGVFTVLSATAAGLMYGLVYVKTQRIETAVLTHFLTNCVHILLFSYPRLA